MLVEWFKLASFYTLTWLILASAKYNNIYLHKQVAKMNIPISQFDEI